VGLSGTHPHYQPRWQPVRPLRKLRHPRRELYEEAGLDADTLHLEEFGIYGDPRRDPRGRVVSVAYLAIMPRLPDPVAGTDAADARWVRADDVLTGRMRLAFDHRRIVADGVECARRKLENSALATTFCGSVFTIAELQQVYEAVWGIPLDPRNFYRKIQGTRDFVIPAAAKRTGNGRPARLFRAGTGTVLNPPMTRPADQPLPASKSGISKTGAAGSPWPWPAKATSLRQPSPDGRWPSSPRSPSFSSALRARCNRTWP
jgi:8-oxo-dGTP diphosphatase